jgi:NADPH2:quinone reductase
MFFMKAWLLDSIGSLDHLRMGDAPEPTAGAGEVVLEVEFASLNPADRFLAEGQYPARPPLPHVLGRDAVGTVSAVGQGVEGVWVGDRRLILRTEVGVSRWGTFAERVAVPVVSLVEPPAGWSAEQAAAAPLVYLTAYQALTTWGELPPGVVLVTGASGGVGVASVQLARALGHTVIALSRNPQKAARLEQLGAHRVFDPNDPEWRRRLTEALRGRRVDLAVDNVGGPLFPAVLETLGEHGRVSCVGRLAGPVPQFNTAWLFFRRLRIGGVAVGAYTPAEAREAWAGVLRLLDVTGARPLIDSVWEFGRLREAFDRLAPGPMGKVLLRVKG